MSSSNDDGQDLAVWIVLIGVVLLTVGLVVGVGVSKSFEKPPAAPVPANAAVAASAELAADQNAVRVENGVVKFYFASGKADLATGAQEALAEVVHAAQAGKHLVISGFHDSTGSLEVNQQLAKTRAIAVQDMLKTLGVPEAQLSLKKPENVESATAGADALARRVEVAIE